MAIVKIKKSHIIAKESGTETVKQKDQKEKRFRAKANEKSTRRKN